MTTELLCWTHDALYDAKRLKRECKWLDDEWDDCKRRVEGGNMDSSYQKILGPILRSVEMLEHCKRERGDVIYIDDEDDCDGENDLQFELFLSSLRADGKSYVAEGENDGVPFRIKYEAESGSEDEREQESHGEMEARAEQMVGLSNGVVAQQGSDPQAQSDNGSSTRRARALMNPVGGRSVRGREGASSAQKPDLRANRSVQNQHGRVQHLCSGKNNVANYETSERSRKTLVRVHHGPSSQRPGTRINWLAGNESDDDRAEPVEKEKVQSRRRSGRVVEEDQGAGINALIPSQMPGRRNNRVIENLCERVGPAQIQPGERVARGSTTKGDCEVLERAVIQVDDEHLYHRLGQGNNNLVKCHSNRADQARVGKKIKVLKLKGKRKVAEGTNLVKEEKEPDEDEVIEIDCAQFYQKSGPGNNLYGNSDQAQRGKKDKVHSQIHSEQPGKGENVIDDSRANRMAIVRMDNERLHQKPSQKNNRLTEYQNECVDQARSVKGYMGEDDRKSKGKNKVEVKQEANNKAIVQIDNENSYQDPGPRNHWLTRNNCGDHGSSDQKIAFGNYALKKEPDDSVRTRLDTERLHNRMRSIETVSCSATYKDGGKINLIKEGNDEVVPEVEILDGAPFIKRGALSPFVPSKRFHITMMDDDVSGGPSASDEFREEVLKVIRKPYDREEYVRLQKEIRDGSYFSYHPDLKKKLKKHRYKRGKCVAILRGFFFWLKNLTREGAFPPWKDRQCLAVEPPPSL